MLNLPEEVAFNDGDSIKFFYSAEGEKLRTVYTISGAISQKDSAAISYMNQEYRNTSSMMRDTMTLPAVDTTIT